MEKLIAQVALFRRGVEKFEDEVNEHLNEGWKIESISIEKHGLRIICWALLKQDGE